MLYDRFIVSILNDSWGQVEVSVTGDWEAKQISEIEESSLAPSLIESYTDSRSR